MAEERLLVHVHVSHCEVAAGLGSSSNLYLSAKLVSLDGRDIQDEKVKGDTVPGGSKSPEVCLCPWQRRRRAG